MITTNIAFYLHLIQKLYNLLHVNGFTINARNKCLQASHSTTVSCRRFDQAYQTLHVVCMGVDHGVDRGTSPSPEFGAGGALMQIVPPPRFCHRYKNEHSVAFEIRQNPFTAGALPRTPLGELTTLPRPLSRLERGHPSPYSTSLGTDPPSALAMCPPPQKSSQIYTLRLCIQMPSVACSKNN